MAKDNIKPENPAEQPAEEKTAEEKVSAEAAEEKKETEKKPDKKADKKKNFKKDKDSEKVKELEAKVAELTDKYMRTAAEYENYRKRTAKEKENIDSDVKVDVIAKLLPVIDDFERASAAQSDPENYKQGVEMIVKKLLGVFENMGVEAFGEAGDEFDPNIHNGVMHVDDENLGENVVADVFMKGYKLGDRVVRCATVKVAN